MNEEIVKDCICNAFIGFGGLMATLGTRAAYKEFHIKSRWTRAVGAVIEVAFDGDDSYYLRYSYLDGRTSREGQSTLRSSTFARFKIGDQINIVVDPDDGTRSDYDWRGLRTLPYLVFAFGSVFAVSGLFFLTHPSYLH